MEQQQRQQQESQQEQQQLVQQQQRQAEQLRAQQAQQAQQASVRLQQQSAQTAESRSILERALEIVSKIVQTIATFGSLLLSVLTFRMASRKEKRELAEAARTERRSDSRRPRGRR